MNEPQPGLAVGTRVRVERDEELYPSRGTWPRFRGRAGTVVEINRDRKRPHLTEYGVGFGKVTARTDGRGAFNWDADDVAWFKSYELAAKCRGASQRAHSAANTSPVGQNPGEPLNRQESAA